LEKERRITAEQTGSKDDVGFVAVDGMAKVLLLALVFILSYALVGFAGITLQSAQAGVTPVWPASGIAFGLCYWFGLRYALLIAPSMLALGLIVDVPLPVIVLATAGSMLEAWVAVWLLRRLRIDPSLMQLRDSLLFVLCAAVLAPLFSAGAGTLAMTWYTDNPVAPQYIAAMWWLGNSLGLLVVGGLALAWPMRRRYLLHGLHWLELIGLCLVALLLTGASIPRVEHITSALIFYLLVPLVVVAALRIGQFGVLMVATTVLCTLMAANSSLPHAHLGKHELGMLYLDISLVWMATFTGLIVGSARQERRQREEVSWLATHDPLTDLVNRHEFVLRLERALVSARAQGRTHAVLYVDLDHFKRINDAEGHAAGDRILRNVAGMLTGEVRRRDTVARTGGDEFALLLESCPLVEACGIAENIRRALENYQYRGMHGDYVVEASIGVVEVDAAAEDSSAVLHGADEACYAAKTAGRNRVWVGNTQPQEDEA
jgi:diguanylate cyclase (GGDEF)-like protein